MARYLIRRVFTMFLVLSLSTATIFFILEAAPGSALDTVRRQANSPNRQTAADLDQIRHSFGLDKPAHLRYLIWLAGDDWIEQLPVWFTGLDYQGHPFTNGERRGVLRGDFGVSLSVLRGDDVLDVIKGRLGNTLYLMSGALLLSLLVAVPVGVLSAVRQYSTLDYVATSFSFVGISVPIFWLGLMMIILFSLKFREWGLPNLPSGGVLSLRAVPGYPAPGSPGDRLIHLIMPTLALSLLFMAGWSRFMRASMLEVLGQDYIRVARAKGLRERVVIARHALRNALIPLITIITLQLPGLFGGAVVTETVFGYSGMGRLFFLGLGRNDWPVVMGYLVILSFLVVVCNLIADLAFAVVDPRIKYS